MSLITTLENQCRALTSVQSPDENASRFLVGTLSPNNENLIYLFEYKDDNNNLAKVSFRFPYGETWHLNTSSKHPNLLTAAVGHKNRLGISVFKLPQELESPIEDDYGLSESAIEKVFDVTTEDKNNLTRQCHWHPDDGDHLLTCNNVNLEFWDLNTQQQSLEFSMSKVLEKSDLNYDSVKRVPHVTDLRWSSLFNCSVVAAVKGSKIYGFDTRISSVSPSSICWLIEDNRCNRIRSIDFNPNSQYYIASGGDDCRANFWDLRKTSSPSLHLQTHTHWIWSIRYNPFHDQLVLSAGSDARVALMRVQSIASEPFGQMIDCDDDGDNCYNDERIDGALSDENEETKANTKLTYDETLHSNDTEAHKDVTDEEVNLSAKEKLVKGGKKLEDEIINLYEEHDDSVYVAEWATDPWIFASLGFESRLIINKVPKAEKFNILF